MDQHPPQPSGVPAGSRPAGPTPPTGSSAPSLYSPLHAPRAVPADPGRQWPGRRTLDTSQRVWVCVGVVLLAGYLSLVVVIADWAAHPVLASLAVVCGAVGTVGLVASAWARRPDRALIHGGPLRGLPRPARRALVRDLRAGHLGPPEQRAYAIDWACRTLQAPWVPAQLLVLAAISVGNLARTGINATWTLVFVTVLVVSVSLGAGLELVRRRAAHRVADALDRLHAVPPPLSEPA